ncbi:Constitutive coactivator of PPAR-gamma protein 1 [Daphnia magna]|uniref:Constitutive coactivator of PPAR-gamma protein 1 n=1 Tax=Daphnia magna TaxID=35525 RepID=A0A164XMC5_9CRUS|nr:Constitutive coactivator of PPAR-gamma protein 1 [Daphnia magna]
MASGTMGLQSLQQLIESQFAGACVSVDLLRIASSVASPYQGRVALSLVVDAECCLDRLYGGYVSDWICGGQWNRMLQFLASLVQTLHAHNLHLAVFFNGSLEPPRMHEWVRNQLAARSNIYQVLRHLHTKGTPPPKVWWVPPSTLRTALRLALRHLKIAVLSSVDDHHQEVIGFCRDNHFHGILAEDAEYAIFDPPRYFSSKQLKLTYKGSLETKEFILDEVAKGLNLNPNRFCVLAALLGNFLLTDADLREFHKRICEEYQTPLNQPEGVIRAVASFVRELPSNYNLESVGAKVFNSTTDGRVNRFKQAVNYFLNGTRDQYGRHKNSTLLRQHNHHHEGKQKHGNVTHESKARKLASEAADEEQNEIPDAVPSSGDQPPEEVIENGGYVNGGSQPQGSSSGSSSGATSPHREREVWGGPKSGEGQYQPCLPPVAAEVLRTAYERHRRGLMSPYMYQLLTQGEIRLPVVLEDQCHREVPNIQLFYRPVRQMVYAILFNLHHHTFLAEKQREQPHEKTEANGVANGSSTASVSASTGSYVPPQSLNGSGSVNQSNPLIPEIKIREWVWTAANPYRHPEIVVAAAVGWPVPTVHRLWFGTSMDDKKRRLRAFLSCLHADTVLMLNPEYVPQHLLILACVLRYIMAASQGTILQKQELDALIVQAFAMEITNPNYLQDLQLTKVSARGVQLATLVMEGVETALLVNDACGSPVPWPVCCPWLFFDGKLFHTKLSRTQSVRDLHELCEHRGDLIMKVEKLRKAILDGLVLTPLPPRPPALAQMHDPAWASRDFLNGPFNINLPGGLKRGGQRRGVARGGQLEVAGVVVSSWVPNYGGPRGRGHMGPAAGRGGGVVPTQNPSQRNGHVHYSTRGGRAARGGRRGGHQATQRKQTSAASANTPAASQSNGKASVNSNESSDTNRGVKLLTHETTQAKVTGEEVAK